MSNTSLKYKGARIELDLEQMRFMRESDNDWMSLPEPKFIVLSERKMSQRAGMIGARTMHKYNAFAVFLRAGNINILVYQGRRDKVEYEAKKLSDFLNIEIKDLFPRDEKGKVVDDDYGDSDLKYWIISLIVIALLFVLVALFLTPKGRGG